MVAPEVTRDELKAFLLGEKGDYVLIDVREPWEIAKYGKIPTAKNVPLSQFAQLSRDADHLSFSFEG